MSGRHERSDDPVVALTLATQLYAPARFDLIASVDGDTAAAARVTQTADAFVAWLRRPATVRLTFVGIEEQDTGEVVSTTPGGSVTTFDSSQQARYVIDAADDRGFPVDTTFEVSVTDAIGGATAVATAAIEEASSGTASGKDELVVKAGTEAGSALVKVFDPANPDTIFASDAVDVVPGGVATVVLGTPTIEEQPTP